MKKFVSLISLMFLLLSCDVEEKTYCGIVKDKYLLHVNNGHAYNIVFVPQDSTRSISFVVDANTYVNTQIGQPSCFNLSEYNFK